MANINEDFEALIVTLRELFVPEDNYPEHEVLSTAKARIEQVGYDNWDGGTDIYGIYFEIPIKVYACYEDLISTIEESIKEKLQTILRKYKNVWIGELVISPQLSSQKYSLKKSNLNISDKELIDALESQKKLMITVSTGGPRIQSVNNDYKDRQQIIEMGLNERNIENLCPYSDLWEWYGKWSSGDLPSYQSRRMYINGLFGPVVKHLIQGQKTSQNSMFTMPTGWARVDRNISEVRTRLGQAKSEEQFQAVGLLCREAMISLAQAVYDPNLHPTSDGVTPSETDSKRMLDAYLISTLSGGINETARRHAKAALGFANEVLHKRSADFRQTAMCAEATSAVINIIAIISGQRDPN